MSSLSPLAESVTCEKISLTGTEVIARRLSDYRQLVRPRILIMSSAAVVAGFILASPGP